MIAGICAGAIARRIRCRISGPVGALISLEAFDAARQVLRIVLSSDDPLSALDEAEELERALQSAPAERGS
jgi:hypothetical protein